MAPSNLFRLVKSPVQMGLRKRDTCRIEWNSKNFTGGLYLGFPPCSFKVDSDFLQRRDLKNMENLACSRFSFILHLAHSRHS